MSENSSTRSVLDQSREQITVALAVKNRTDVEGEKNKTAEERNRRLQPGNLKEIAETGPRNKEEILAFIEGMDPTEFLQQELEKKRGKGWWEKLGAACRGEYATEITAEGKMKQQGWGELIHRGAKILKDKRLLFGAGACIAIGVVTGGVGVAAAGALFGAVAGRAAGETAAAFSKEEFKARESLFVAQQTKWWSLKTMAVEYRDAEANGDQEVMKEKLKEIVDLYFSTTNEEVQAQKEIGEKQQKWDKISNNLQTIGGIGGVAAGVGVGHLLGSFSGVDIDLWNKVDGQSVFHDVQRGVDGNWHFLQRAGEKIGEYTVQRGDTIYHALGEPAWKVYTAAAAKALPVLGAMWAGTYFENQRRAGAEKEEQTQRETEQQSQQAGKENLIQRDQEIKEAYKKPPTPEELQAQKEKVWLERINKEFFGIPLEEGQDNWYYGKESGKVEWRAKIQNVDYQNGLVRIQIYKEIELNKGDGKVEKKMGWIPEKKPLKIEDFYNNYYWINFEEKSKSAEEGPVVEKSTPTEKPPETGQPITPEKVTTPGKKEETKFNEGDEVRVMRGRKLETGWKVGAIVGDEIIVYKPDPKTGNETDRIPIKKEKLEEWQKLAQKKRDRSNPSSRSNHPSPGGKSS